ncbi:MAG: HNH endonuclease [Nitrosarchaeum sp.]|nr:HNH endonuclease [Nitrosarchaeum sp.]
MVRKLSYNLKKKYFSLILQRDGHACFYCKGKFSENHIAEYEHLNNIETDNRLENLVFAHHECNNRKKFNTDLQILATEKLRENEKAVFVGEGNEGDVSLSEQEISKINRGITKMFLTEHTMNGQSLMINDAVNAIVNLCNHNNSTGSQSAIYRYIDAMCNSFNGDFIKEKNPDGKLSIRKKYH